jgi:hypothetical protein
MAMTDRTDLIRRACQALGNSSVAAARNIIQSEYPFSPVIPGGRRYTELQSVQVFMRDGFIDRYSGQRLVFPGVLRLLSRIIPVEFPFHPNWKMSETHPAYWELFPTIDHVIPIARGGPDCEVNWVTTSMLRNTAKANGTLAELGWDLHEPGLLTEWDGLMGFFLEFIDSDNSPLKDAYLHRWYSAAVRRRADD